jgi:CubicO group peptidase (beta-lactamase class C family)
MTTKLILTALMMISCAACTGGSSGGGDGTVDPNAINPLAPTITAISPNEGPVTGNTVIKITGTGFSASSKVYIGNFLLKLAVQSTFVRVLSPTEMVVMVPPYFVTRADIAIYNSATAISSPAWGAYNYKGLPPDVAEDPGASPSMGDTLGMFASEASHYTLYPANRASPLDIRFQTAFNRTGFAGAQPVAGRFDGLPGDTVGFYDARIGKFHLKYSNDATEPDLVFNFPAAPKGGIAVSGDFNNDGVDTVGVYNPARAEFRIKNTNEETSPELVFNLGAIDGTVIIPFAGDFNGDGIDTIGYYNPLTTEISLKNSNISGGPDVVYKFGHLNTTPVVGDWNNDGVDTISMYDRMSNQLLIKNSNAAGAAEIVIALPSRNVSLSPIAGRWRAGSTAAPYIGYDWVTATPQEQRINPTMLEAAFAKARQSTFLKSLLVVRNAKLIREEYFNGARPEIAFNVKSVSKSFLSALYGIAEKDGTLPDMNAPISRYLPASYFPADMSSPKYQITLNHLVTMTAGLKYDEGDTDNMMSIFSKDDWHKETLAKDMVTAPGAEFVYSTGLTVVAARILEEQVRKVHNKSLVEYANEKLFVPMGAKLLRWDDDPLGYKVGGAEMFVTSRDMARFGQMYLNGGKIGDRNNQNLVQVVPADWVTKTVSPIKPVPYIPGRYYGGWWWMETIRGYYCFMALGYGGQMIAVIPQLNFIMVTTSKHDVPVQMEGYQDTLIFDFMKNDLIPAITP